MLKEGKFGVSETVSLLTIAIGNKVFSTTPGYLTRVVGNAGWYMTLISVATATLFFTVIYLLLKRFPGKNIVEIYNASLGKFIGFIFSFILMVTFLMYSGIFTREFSDIAKVYDFPLTPQGFMIGFLLIIAAIGAFLGLESIARVAKLFAYFALLGFLLILVLAIPNYRIDYLFPIFGNGIDKTLITGITRGSAYGEIVILAVIAPSLQGSKYIKKAGFITLAISGFILIAGLFCMTLSFTYKNIEEVTVPMYVLVRFLKYGNFFERLDPIYLFLWVITTVIYISILFYTTVSIYCKMFKLSDTRPVIIPMFILVFTVAFLPKDISVLLAYLQDVRQYANISFFILPLIAYIVAVIRKKKGENQNA